MTPNTSTLLQRAIIRNFKFSITETTAPVDETEDDTWVETPAFMWVLKFQVGGNDVLKEIFYVAFPVSEPELMTMQEFNNYMEAALRAFYRKGKGCLE